LLLGFGVLALSKLFYAATRDDSHAQIVGHSKYSVVRVNDHFDGLPG
jgi:hypothetical protein